MPESWQTLELERAGPVLHVWLARPEKRNALNGTALEEIESLFGRLQTDFAARVVVLGGRGPSFCAGADRNDPPGSARMRQSGGASERERRFAAQLGRRACAAIAAQGAVTIARLHGHVLGGGLALALACDLRIAAESAFVTTAYVKLGLSGDYGGSWFLTRLVGPARAREIFFTGDRLDARECERLGIVNRVVPDADLAKASFALAQQLAAGPPVALRYMKENLNRALGESLRSCLDAEAERMVQSATTQDYAEAVLALQEKRAPVFRGE
jgi:enoyl-CoA hydratase/carnithine racemase